MFRNLGGSVTSYTGYQSESVSSSRLFSGVTAGPHQALIELCRPVISCQHGQQSLRSASRTSCTFPTLNIWYRPAFVARSLWNSFPEIVQKKDDNFELDALSALVAAVAHRRMATEIPLNFAMFRIPGEQQNSARTEAGLRRYE